MVLEILADKVAATHTGTKSNNMTTFNVKLQLRTASNANKHLIPHLLSCIYMYLYSTPPHRRPPLLQSITSLCRQVVFEADQVPVHTC